MKFKYRTGRKYACCVICYDDTKDRIVYDEIEVPCCWECASERHKNKIKKISMNMGKEKLLKSPL